MYDVEYINSGRYLCTQYGIIISSFNTLLFSCKVLGSCELLFQGITSWMNVRLITLRTAVSFLPTLIKLGQSVMSLK